MEIDIVPAVGELPVDRAWMVSMVVKTFKGRKDVFIRLFRSSWDLAEPSVYDWPALFGLPPASETAARPEERHRVLLECFTARERDAVVDYLRTHCQDKVSVITACPLDFPIPTDRTALSGLTEGKDIGLIHFDQLPDWNLPFPVRGVFDLSQHRPIIEGFDQT